MENQLRLDSFGYFPCSFVFLEEEYVDLFSVRLKLHIVSQKTKK